MTFSIVARCRESGALGIAVSTAVPAVGAICPYVRLDVGAVSTQSWVNPFLATKALDLLAQGEECQTVLQRVLAEDKQASLRQVGIVDSQGVAVAWTGTECTDWAGHVSGGGFTIQGNMLTGPEVISAMREVYENTVGMPLEERLLRSLEAGQANGGDKRGRQSAALKVFHDQPYPYLDVRVDEHPDPVCELRRIFNVALAQYIPFVESMPTLASPDASPDPAVTELLLKSPAQRSPLEKKDDAQLLQYLLGLNLEPQRLQEILTTYRPILSEIHKLRELDFTNIHPAVVFDPMIACRKDKT